AFLSYRPCRTEKPSPPSQVAENPSVFARAARYKRHNRPLVLAAALRAARPLGRGLKEHRGLVPSFIASLQIPSLAQLSLHFLAFFAYNPRSGESPTDGLPVHIQGHRQRRRSEKGVRLMSSALMMERTGTGFPGMGVPSYGAPSVTP